MSFLLRYAVEHYRLSGERVSTIKFEVPESFLARAKGLIGRREAPPATGMLFKNCRSVHCFGMSMAIDVVFLSRELRVLEITRDVRPGQTAACKRAAHVLELAAGEAKRQGLQIDDTLMRVSPATDTRAG